MDGHVEFERQTSHTHTQTHAHTQRHTEQQLCGNCIYYDIYYFVSFQLVESEVVSENCRSQCQEQRIAYYRFNPQLKKVSIVMCASSKFPCNQKTFHNILTAYGWLPVTCHNMCSAHRLFSGVVALYCFVSRTEITLVFIHAYMPLHVGGLL